MTPRRVIQILASILLLGMTSSVACAQEDPERPDKAPEPVKQQSVPEVRQIPGDEPVTLPFPVDIYESIPRIESSASEYLATPDRWRQFYAGKWYDPYNQNVLKADVPIFGAPGHEWFFELSAISDFLMEFRNLPIPVGGQSTQDSDQNDTFGRYGQMMLVENFLMSFSLIRGNTAFKPPEFEFRITPVFNLNYADVRETGALRADPNRGSERTDDFVGIQEWFADIHLGNVSERYDFVSTRIGIQQFNSDFRGFIYNAPEPGIRFFGNLNNNKWQYNAAYFRRLDKDTNSGINTTFDDRFEDVYIFNLFRQDAPVFGHTMQLNVLHREDTAGEHAEDYDNNGFLIRPAAIGDERDKNVYSTHIGLTGDGHFGRLNTTTAIYYVTGSESHNPIAQRQVDISAGMFAQEFSYDIDWVRLRASFLWASGDDDPFDNDANGFDTIIDNPNFAGGDIGYIQRQGIPLIGGGGVALFNRNSFFPDLKPGKEEGQSNFVNPGLRLYNLGVDFEVTPKLKLITNGTFYQFDNVEVLKAVRQDGTFDRDVGFDLSAGFLYRPFLNNNVQFRLGGAVLFPGDGFENLYGDKVLYDVFSNLIFQY